MGKRNNPETGRNNPETGRKKSPNWEEIEALYRAGQLSIRAIADVHGVSDTAIRKRASANAWERDLTDKVRKRVRTELVRRGTQVRKEGSQCEPFEANDPGLEEEAIIRAATDSGVEVALRGRSRFVRWGVITDIYAKTLEDQFKTGKRTVLDRSGEAVEIDVDLEYVGKCLTHGTSALQKINTMERQSYNLDDKDEGGDKEIESVLDLIQGQKDGLPS